MGCQWRCRCFRVSPLLRPGVWSGGAVVGGINCQLMWQVAETDSQGSKQPCGTFPRLHTNTYYLHIHVSLFCSRQKKKNPTKNNQRLATNVHVCRAESAKNLPVTKLLVCQCLLHFNRALLLSVLEQDRNLIKQLGHFEYYTSKWSESVFLIVSLQ